MTNWQVLAVILVVAAVSLSHEEEILERPARPAEFRNKYELQKFINDMKNYAVMNSSRYGKRFSPPAPAPAIEKARPETFYGRNINKQDLHDFYEFFKQYNRF